MSTKLLISRFARVATAALLAAPVLVMGQGSDTIDAEDEAAAAKAQQIAREFEAEARVLTIFDRQGNIVTTVGERALYRDPVFSPDRSRLAVIKVDIKNEFVDLWVFDLAAGTRIAITANKQWDFEWVNTPVWSPDGVHIAYMAMRNGYEGLYRKRSDGEGAEELLYRYPGANMGLRDWSIDGRYLSFSASDLSGGTLFALRMTGDGESTPIEILSTDTQLWGSSFSLDNRFLSYESEESGKSEVYVRPFDPSGNAGSESATEAWQVSENGGLVLNASWRSDGKEFYYMAADDGVMAVEVSTEPTLEIGKPRLLFRLSEAVPGRSRMTSVSRDGERFVIAVPHAPTLQQIVVFDRQGKLLTQVGEPGRYANPALSPDGTKVAVERVVRQTGNEDIWTFDIETGVGTPVTNDTAPDRTPIWSPDSRRVAYQSIRGELNSIYLKAMDGSGDEEQFYQYTPGAFMQPADWSADGKFVTFHDGCWGVLYVVPVGGDEDAVEREAIEWLRDEFSVAQARFSPDSRYIAYMSDEIAFRSFQVYVGPFDASKSDGGGASAVPVQISHDGALGMIFWRQDGKELYYLNSDWEVMVVDVATTPTFVAGTPRVLFKLPGPLGPLRSEPGRWRNVSPDGERFVFVINVSASIAAP
jgi:Tol biopolymer transport system component